MKWFQNFGHNKSRYERPNQKWVCGYAKDGWSCPQGPNAQGKCCSTSECIPYKKKDRWFCSRSENYGGPCDQGPLPDGTCCHPIKPCQPSPSIRTWRGRVTFAVSSVVVAIFFIFFSGPQRDQLASPGVLSAHHAPLASNCSSCHAVDQSGFQGWVQNAIYKNPPIKQSQLCLKCHANFNQPNIQKPHGLSLTEMEQMTDRIGNSSDGLPGSPFLTQLLPSVPHFKNGDIDCAICHREHHGAKTDLTAMTSQQCQSCHIRQFESFASGHPSFGRTLLTREDVLDWSQWLSHLKTEKDQAGSISQVAWGTMPSALQNNLLQNQTLGTDSQRAVISSINQVLKERAKTVSQTTGASLVENAKKVRLELQNSFPEDLAPRFSFPYQRRTPIAFNHDSHFKIYFPAAKDIKPPSLCTDCHAPDSTRQEMIFTGFQQNCASCHNRMITASSEDKTKGVALIGIPAVDLEELRRVKVSIGQYPANAKGELSSFTKLLLAGDPKYPQLEQDLILLQPFSCWEDLSNTTQPQLEALQRIIWGLKRLFVECATQGKAALKTRLQNAVGDCLTPDMIDYIVRPLPIEVIKNLQTKAFPQASSELLGDQLKLGVSSLHQNDDSMDYVILYQPKKHTDNYLQAWLTALAASKHAKVLFESSPELHQNFQSCIICHSAEQNKDQTISVNWNAFTQEPSERKFTKFSHSPHLSMDCIQCHALPKNVNNDRFKAAFHRVNAASFEPVFQSMVKEDCMKCHLPKVAGDNCLTCHQYHVGHFKSQIAGK